MGIAAEAVNATDGEGSTALAYLADGPETDEHLILVKNMLKAGANFSGRISPFKLANSRQNY